MKAPMVEKGKHRAGSCCVSLTGILLLAAGLLLTAQPAPAKPFSDTLNTDFQAGADDNILINQTIQGGLQLAPAAMLGNWTSSAGPSGSVYQAAAVAYNGKAYIIGGKGMADTSSTVSQDMVLDAIHYGNILADGTVDKWDPDKLVTLQQPTYGHAAVVVNGRLYIIGGRSASESTLNSVYWGRIVGNDGQIKALYQPNTWTAVAPLPTPLFQPAAFHYEGRIYVLGGQDNSKVTQSVVYYALVQPDGNIIEGSWQRASQDMPAALCGHSVAVSNGRIYVVGGSTTNMPMNVQNQVYVGQIDSVTGDVTGWTVTTPLPVALWDAAAAVAGGKLWVCGGATSGTAIATSLVFHTALMQNTGLIPVAGKDTWTRGTDLPGPVKWHSLVSFNNHLLVLGGNNNTGAQKNIYTTTLIRNNQNPNSRFLPTTPLFLTSSGGSRYSTWTGHTALVKAPLVTNQSDSGSETTQPSLYVLGGGDNDFRVFPDGNWTAGANTPVAKGWISQATLDNSGAVQTWSADPAKSQLPMASILHCSTVAMDNQMYVIGGANTGNAAIFAGAASRSEVAFAETDTYTAMTQPKPETWYFIGKAHVFYETASSGSGSSSLGSFESTTPIPIQDPSATTYCAIYQPLIRAAAASYNDCIYVMGGISRRNTGVSLPLNPTGSTAVYEQRVWFCRVNPGGTIDKEGGWRTTTPLPLALYDLAAVVANDRLYIFGGRDSAGNQQSTVYFAEFNSDGTLGSWTPTTNMILNTLSYDVAETAVVFTAGRFYVLGGSRSPGDTLQQTVLYCTPDPITGQIPASGDNAWSDSPTWLESPVAGHAAVAVNGRIYVLGGRYSSPAAHSSSAYMAGIADIVYTQNNQPTATTYAWDGTFERYIDLDNDQYIDNLSWLGNDNGEAMRVKCRYALEEGRWSEWTPEQTVSPVYARRIARYVHYKVSLQTSDNAPGVGRTPLLTRMDLNYATSKKVEIDGLMLNHNRFDPQTTQLTISYKTRDHDVSNAIFRVYNTEGELIRRYDIDIPGNTPLPATGAWIWDGTNENGEMVANGVYIIQYNSGDTHKIRKVLVLKR